MKEIVDFLDISEAHHNYNSRGRKTRIIPFCRLSKNKYYFPIPALSIFNALPDALKEL